MNRRSVPEPGRATALVRPDGYLAAVGTVPDMTAIRHYLQDLAGTSAPVASAAEHAIR